MKKRLLAIAMATLMGFSLVACSSGSSEPKVDGSSKAEESKDGESKADESKAAGLSGKYFGIQQSTLGKVNGCHL